MGWETFLTRRVLDTCTVCGCREITPPNRRTHRDGDGHGNCNSNGKASVPPGEIAHLSHLPAPTRWGNSIVSLLGMREGTTTKPHLPCSEITSF